jgi:oxidoreductase
VSRVDRITPVRVALVGLGWAGRSIWLPRLQADDGYDVVAVVDPAPGLTLEGVPVVAHPGDLDPAGVDLAVVAVPNHLHAPVAAALLRRGISVFVEKPVCLSSGEAATLAAAEAAGGAVLLAGSASRYRADVRALYELAATLGPVRHVDVAWVRARGVPGRDGWFTRRELSGGGALLDLGWHLLDAAAPLLGPAPIAEAVGSMSGDFVNRQASRAAWRAEDASAGSAGDVEDTARGFLLTGAGTSLSLRASWASHEALDRTVIRVEAAGGTATLECTFGFSPNRAEGSHLSRTVDGVTDTRAVGEPIGAEYDRQLAELPDVLADPAARGAAIAEARRTIDVIERLYRTAATPAPPTHGIPVVDLREPLFLNDTLFEVGAWTA